MKISRPAALWSTWESFDWSNGLEYTQLHSSNFKYVFTLHKTSQYYQYTWDTIPDQGWNIGARRYLITDVLSSSWSDWKFKPLLPWRPTNSAISPGNFEMLLRLNGFDLWGLFLIEWQPDLDYYSIYKKSAQVKLVQTWEHFKVARGYGTICGSLG